MQRLEGLAVVAEPHRQPVEQLRMTRSSPHATEIIGRLNQSTAEVMLPNPVHDGPPGQDVGWISNPLGQGHSALAFRQGRIDLESTAQAQGPRHTRCYLIARFAHITARQQVNGPWLSAIGSGPSKSASPMMHRARINHPLHRKG